MSAHILVVDDEPDVRELLGTWLEAAGYRITQAADAGEAMAALAARPVDLVLLDLAMPGRDGLWLARQCREQFADLGLILVTGLQRFDAAVEGMRLGIRDYVVKPFTREELLESVKRAIDWQASRRRDRDASQALLRDLDRRRRALAQEFAALDPVSAAAIDALLVTLHRRSPDAAAHARRIARMTIELGAALDLAPAALGAAECAALLHDIGKVAMPDALMYKAVPLTDTDIALLRSHVEVGHAIVATIPALQEAADIVLSSHEAWDGSGYPRGLEREEIPLGARIISVVDTFDALTWGRLHRDPVSHARAAAELVRCAGTQFDPRVVQAWLRVCDGLHAAEVPAEMPARAGADAAS